MPHQVNRNEWQPQGIAKKDGVQKESKDYNKESKIKKRYILKITTSNKNSFKLLLVLFLTVNWGRN